MEALLRHGADVIVDDHRWQLMVASGRSVCVSIGGAAHFDVHTAANNRQQ